MYNKESCISTMKSLFLIISLLIFEIGFSQTCQTIDFSLDSAFPVAEIDGVIKVCVGESITLEGSATFSDNASGATYEWDLDDGNVVSGATATFSYDTPGVYIVNLKVLGVTPVRCNDSIDIDQVIQVSTQPDFSKAEASKTILCYGESATLISDVRWTPFDATCTPPVGNTTALPDGVGVSYSSVIYVSCFEDTDTLTDISQLESICFNMEHSFVGDLHIDIVAPNGTSVRILTSLPNTPANLGIPWADRNRADNSGNKPGQGKEYCIKHDSNLPTLIEGIQSGGVFPILAGPDTYIDDYIPEGDYKSENSLEGLLGTPLNGYWRLRVTDNIGGDNGYIFGWSINFNPSILPVDYSFTNYLTSVTWDWDSTTTNAYTSPSGNDLIVQPLIPGTHTYTLRIFDDFGCEYTKEIMVESIREVSIKAEPIDVVLCDINGDGKREFDFTNNGSLVLGGQTSSEVIVTYHSSESNALNNTASLSALYTNNYPNETIWVRIADVTQRCFEITSFNISVVPFPVATQPRDYTLCDDTSVGSDTDGFVNGFDLTTKVDEILGSYSPNNFNVRFYYSQADAEAGNDAAEITTTIQNTTNPQPIFARIESNDSAICYDVTSFNIAVSSLPVMIATDVVLEQCDDDTDGKSLFNLTEANILMTNETGLTITYYQTLAGAQTGLEADRIVNVMDYPNNPNLSSPENEIFARLENGFGCYKAARIQLVVGVSQIPSSFQTLQYAVCDDEQLDGDKRNGIATFDFSDAKSQIEALFSGGGITVSFYNNEADALAEINAIQDTSNHRNEGYPNQQDIYVRVDSNVLNACLGLGHHITLTVEALPIAHPVAFAVQCEDDPTDGSISYPFDTSNLESDLLQGQTNVLVEYFDANGNPLQDFNGNPITSQFPNTFRTETQTITARVTNTVTNTNNNTPCYDETQITFTVDQQPQAFPITIPPQCDNGAYTTDGIGEFDTSTIQSTILGNQSNMDIVYTDENGNLLPTPLPDPFVSPTQTVTATVSNPLNLDCYASVTLSFVVNPLPQFEVEEDRVVCTNLVQSILLEVLNPQEDNYTYSWTNSEGEEISTDPQVTVSIPDDYTVIATSTLGCPSLPRVVNVAESTLPTTSEEDITVVENSNHNSITINNVENRGYDFALDDEFGPFQDEPFFNNVLAGEHIVYVRSKEGCGTAAIKVFILGFPKFFTPNNDGYHDTWQILGLGSDYTSDSKVSIYDRYGKLLKMLNAKNNSWDGLFKGSKLPASDYWYVAELFMGNNELKVYKGHFSLKR